jgi:hypothetical protein
VAPLNEELAVHSGWASHAILGDVDRRSYGVKKRLVATTSRHRGAHKNGRGREVHAWQTPTEAIGSLLKKRTAGGNAGRFLLYAR